MALFYFNPHGKWNVFHCYLYQTLWCYVCGAQKSIFREKNTFTLLKFLDILTLCLLLLRQKSLYLHPTNVQKLKLMKRSIFKSHQNLLKMFLFKTSYTSTMLADVHFSLKLVISSSHTNIWDKNKCIYNRTTFLFKRFCYVLI